MIESIFKTYVAASPVDVHYYNIKYENRTIIVISKIIVVPDNRPLYRTRTKELDEEIIKLINEASIELANKKSTSSLTLEVENVGARV